MTQLGALRSEWTKLWSLRSTRWSLLVAVIAMAGLGVLISAIQMSRWNQMSAGDRASFNAVGHSLGGWHLSPTGDRGPWRVGHQRGVLDRIDPFHVCGSATPTAGALGQGGCVRGRDVRPHASPSALVAFFASQAIFTEHHVQTSLTAPHVARAVIGAALFLTAVGLLGLALGALVRNTAGGIATFAGLMFVLPRTRRAVAGESGAMRIDPYLPLSAGSAIMATRPDSSSPSPWAGFAVFCGYTVVLGALAAYLLIRRDT